MNELIKLNETKIGNEAVQTVNARDLHAFLEVGKDFSTWIKNRLETLGSVKNEDYLSTKIGEQLPSGTKYKTEYFVTLDTAKHLAMMEKNEKGLQIRQYFIECEKQLREVVQVQTAQAIKPQPARIIGATEDKLNTIILALQHTSLSDIAKETYIITSAETLTGVYLGYRPKIEQTTYSAKKVGDMLGISANVKEFV